MAVVSGSFSRLSGPRPLARSTPPAPRPLPQLQQRADAARLAAAARALDGAGALVPDRLSRRLELLDDVLAEENLRLAELHLQRLEPVALGEAEQLLDDLDQIVDDGGGVEVLCDLGGRREGAAAVPRDEVGLEQRDRVAAPLDLDDGGDAGVPELARDELAGEDARLLLGVRLDAADVPVE